MTENKNFWCNAFGKLVWQVYIKLEIDFNKLINGRDYHKIAGNSKYIREVYGIRSELKSLCYDKAKKWEQNLNQSPNSNDIRL